ncbi:HAD family hydrolase [Clostridiaceae bacterium 68-1-5]|uniref:HAD family hydrolase n=1 Tax=Suipraeoptans intestinalis TaxID=2606628 RepID=A0A6N7V1M1_9FIRM|nr:HAD family hydrolase [Suipraeoptans intestinalis]MSR94030.1 HAD family hydrolase [Suipraeoptans intestinalis]
MIKLIVSDLDGTLLKDGAQQLDPSLFPLIMELKERGIQFAAASGRQLHSLHQLFAPIRDDIYYIAENGSLCIQNATVLVKGEIPRDLGLELFRFSRNYPHCSCLLSCESCAYTDSKSDGFLHLMQQEIRSNIYAVEDLSQVEETFLKISFCDFTDTEALFQQSYRSFSSRLRVVTAGPGWIDFAAIGVNKGTALARLTDYLRIRPKECMAFGDEYNDKELLQFAGTSYAMASGAEGIRKYATHITDSVENVLRDLLDSLPARNR